MFTVIFVFIGCSVHLIAGAERLEVNDRCISKTGPGVCVHQDHCTELKDGYYQGTYTNDDIINCGYDVKKEIICCPIQQTEIGYRPQFQPEYFNENEKHVNIAPASSQKFPGNSAIGTHETMRPAEKACQQITSGLATQSLYNGPALPFGHPVNFGDYPHMAAIGFTGIENQAYHFLCSGSLIANKFILTAAQCFNRPNMKPAIAVLGVTSLRDAEQRRQATEVAIKQIHIHPQYHSDSTKFDLAIVELFNEVPLNNHVYPICLTTNPNAPVESADAYVTGWGIFRNKDSEKSEILLKSEQRIVKAADCSHLLKDSLAHGADDLICASSSYITVDNCLGDIGGPLQVEVNHETKQNILVGINLLVFGCGHNKQSIYTRVSSHLAFIESIVWPH